MSLYDFKRATLLARADEPFYALVMAAMLRADTDNAARLRNAFPNTYAECDARYHSGGGRIPGDLDYEQVQSGRALLGLPPT